MNVHPNFHRQQAGSRMTPSLKRNNADTQNRGRRIRPSASPDGVAFVSRSSRFTPSFDTISDLSHDARQFFFRYYTTFTGLIGIKTSKTDRRLMTLDTKTVWVGNILFIVRGG